MIASFVSLISITLIRSVDRLYPTPINKDNQNYTILASDPLSNCLSLYIAGLTEYCRLKSIMVSYVRRQLLIPYLSNSLHLICKDYPKFLNFNNFYTLKVIIQCYLSWLHYLHHTTIGI